MVNWKKVRNQFPALKDQVYLNAASVSPVPRIVAKAGQKYYEELANYNTTAWDGWEKKREEARNGVAKLLNADKSEIAFMENTSSGMNLLAQMLGGRGGVVTMEDEFPATTIPWIWRKYKIRFVQPEENIYSLELIKKSVDKETKILLTSHVQYKTGFRQDLEELGRWCKENGLIFVVNATQSFGAMPINVKQAKVDFLVFNGVKWGISGGGAAALYINKEWFSKVKFPIVGCESVKDWEAMDNRNFEIRKEASALEVGSSAFAGILAMGAAIEFLLSIGIRNIQQRIFELNEYLVKKIGSLGLRIVTPLESCYRSGITVVQIPNAEKIVEELRKKGVIVSARGEGIRIALHFYNNREDIECLINELRNLL